MFMISLKLFFYMWFDIKIYSFPCDYGPGTAQLFEKDYHFFLVNLHI